METIIQFAKSATPLALLAVALIIIVMLLLPGNSVLSSLISRISRKQKLLEYKTENGIVTLQSLDKKIEKIMGNHLHELPEMKKNIDHVLAKLDRMSIKQSTDSERIARIEGKLDI